MHKCAESDLRHHMRDAKFNDIYEGTYQINLLIVARRLVGYTRDQLKYPAIVWHHKPYDTR